MGVRQGTLAVPFLLPNGSAAAPTYSFAAHPTLGFYDNGSGSLGLSVGGTQGFQWNANAQMYLLSDSAQINMGANSDLILTRAGVGILNVSGQTSQNTQIATVPELLTIAAAATSTTTMQIPAGGILLGVSTRVTTIGVTSWPTTYSVAVGASTLSSGVSTALNTTSASTTGMPLRFASATAVTITPNTTPGDAVGRMRVVLHYFMVTAPTS